MGRPQRRLDAVAQAVGVLGHSPPPQPRSVPRLGDVNGDTFFMVLQVHTATHTPTHTHTHTYDM